MPSARTARRHGRGKELEAQAPTAISGAPTNSEDAEKPISMLGQVAVPAVINAVSRAIGELRRKELEGQAPAAGNGVDAEEKWVAALARVAVPAAISAVPGIINAVRGKEFGSDLASAGGSRPSESIETAEEKYRRALEPVIGGDKIYPPPTDLDGRYNVAMF